MTSLEIHAGACGFIIDITVAREEKGLISVIVDTRCEMVEAFVKSLSNIAYMECLRNVPSNPVFAASFACIRHPGCPVPSGLIKAIEVEVGTSLIKDVSISFQK